MKAACDTRNGQLIEENGDTFFKCNFVQNSAMYPFLHSNKCFMFTKDRACTKQNVAEMEDCVRQFRNSRC
jgi:hypothetical protein